MLDSRFDNSPNSFTILITYLKTSNKNQILKSYIYIQTIYVQLITAQIINNGGSYNLQLSIQNYVHSKQEKSDY